MSVLKVEKTCAILTAKRHIIAVPERFYHYACIDHSTKSKTTKENQKSIAVLRLEPTTSKISHEIFQE